MAYPFDDWADGPIVAVAARLTHHFIRERETAAMRDNAASGQLRRRCGYLMA
ncbi:MAG: hypothetical protein IT523_01715 [Burkholderiales bacterium]|nr:hypothetical protein [Burkholderiales bacterium]